MSVPTLPPDIGAAAFDDLHDDPAAWREVMVSLASEYGSEPVCQAAEGTVLVGMLGQRLVVKLYPPFLRDHFEFERTALMQLGGRLRVPTPELVASGERDGWPFLVMTHLSGAPLTAVWPGLDEHAKCGLLSELGALAAEVHALPVGELVHRSPPWEVFIATQRARCAARQQRTGLPAHLLAQLDDFVHGALPRGGNVILTGEYTPMNLLARGSRLAGMFDFGDGLAGPREYDWLGPLCFLAAGHGARCAAFMSGYGAALDAPLRLALLRLLLLHRYSNLPAQIAHRAWQRAPSFEALAETIWP